MNLNDHPGLTYEWCDRCIAYSPVTVEMFRGLAVDRMSLLDTIGDEPLLEIVTAFIDFGQIADADRVDPGTYDVVGRVLHLALARGLIVEDAAPAPDPDTDPGE